MDAKDKQMKYKSKSRFGVISNDDIASGRRHISKSKSAETLSSEVDPLVLRLRRINAVKALSHCDLKGSIDSCREDSKVHFVNIASVKFFNKAKTSLFPDFLRQPKPEDIPATNSILAKKRIPGFSSFVDKPADVVHVDDDSWSDCTSVPCSSNQEQQTQGILATLKSAMKMQTPECRTNTGNLLERLNGQVYTDVESEVDPPFDSEQLPQTVSEPQEIPASKKWSWARFLCCRRRGSKQEPVEPHGSADSDITNFTTTTSTGSSSKPITDLAKAQYFRDRRQSSLRHQPRISRMVHSLQFR